MRDIEVGIKKSTSVKYELLVNREEAIDKAIKMANTNDVVIIAGKGHETYQIFKDKTIQFDDKAIARDSLLQRIVNFFFHNE
jgi:UDP-N-acetylmuramoyl-L-alanyl-D-glutamate--2,6-diaminopimelate ligase